MELLKDYDVTIQNHSGKSNVVVDALSQKAISMGNLANLCGTKRLLTQTFESKFMQLRNSETCVLLVRIEAKSIFIEEIKGKKLEAEIYMSLEQKMQ